MSITPTERSLGGHAASDFCLRTSMTFSFNLATLALHHRDEGNIPLQEFIRTLRKVALGLILGINLELHVVLW